MQYDSDKSLSRCCNTSSFGEAQISTKYDSTILSIREASAKLTADITTCTQKFDSLLYPVFAGPPGPQTWRLKEKILGQRDAFRKGFVDCGLILAHDACSHLDSVIGVIQNIPPPKRPLVKKHGEVSKLQGDLDDVQRQLDDIVRYLTPEQRQPICRSSVINWLKWAPAQFRAACHTFTYLSSCLRQFGEYFGMRLTLKLMHKSMLFTDVDKTQAGTLHESHLVPLLDKLEDTRRILCEMSEAGKWYSKLLDDVQKDFANEGGNGEGGESRPQLRQDLDLAELSTALKQALEILTSFCIEVGRL
ncbi:hypothetical protein BC938DRAFT_479862 [Jimgerdemannia flammicorona]|uniref:Uncharacterized protein n=1 Tax=Jimgerdemannia flammicorona TaxID=994334 RepID=A0A433QJY3_9FUNG|nr:hypothetical protein BC938DRAFT_479862 [Jimgerdemannia flammicorona]